MPPKVRLLGGVRISDGDRPHHPALQKPVALLAYLACQEGWVPRETLAFLFWPDSDQHRSRTNLRRLIARCRTLPFASALEVEPTRLRFPVECDVVEFRRAINAGSWREAISLYGGDFLPGANFDDSAELAGWLDGERADLKGAYRNAVVRRTDELLERGMTAEAAEVIERLLRNDPVDEEVVQIAMRVLAASGRAERALQIFREFRRRFQSELELQPSAASERLARSIADQASKPGDGDNRAQVEEVPVATEPKTGIPAPINAFVGRAAELSELEQLLAHPQRRLITITGAGGVGKTSLALQAARDWRERCNLLFVPLESVSTVRDLPLAIASAAGITVHGEEDPLERVARSLADRRLLMILDNFEHLIEGAALTTRLLSRCPGLRLIVTSRERLGSSEEWLLPLEGLSLPGQDVAVEEAWDYDAVRFFIERIQQVRPDFQPDDEALEQILRICRLVEGLPLGLELSAAWARALPLPDIASEIEGNLDFLQRTPHAVNERHRSVRAAFDHSWKLLTSEERRVLSRLSVFRGGFRREAASHVAAASIATLASLVDRSLLRVSQTGRYDRHPLLYQFTLENLRQRPDEEAEARQRHAEYHARLLEEAAPHRGTPRQVVWRERLEPERDNLLAALEWAVESEQSELGFRIAAAMQWVWHPGGRVNERRELLERLLSLPATETTRSRAGTLVVAGVMAHGQGDYAAAEEIYREGLSIARAAGAPEIAARLLTNLAHFARLRDDLTTARSLLEESLDLRRKAPGHGGVANTLNNLGTLSRFDGDYETARSLHEEALAIARRIDEPLDIAQSLNGLAYLARAEEDDARARRLLEESLEVSRDGNIYSSMAASLVALGRLEHDHGDLRRAAELYVAGVELQWRQGMRRLLDSSLVAIGALLAADGRLEGAARLWGAAETFRRARAANLPPDERLLHEREVQAARRELGDGRFDAAWAEGRSMEISDAVTLALDALRSP